VGSKNLYENVYGSTAPIETVPRRRPVCERQSAEGIFFDPLDFSHVSFGLPSRCLTPRLASVLHSPWGSRPRAPTADSPPPAGSVVSGSPLRSTCLRPLTGPPICLRRETGVSTATCGPVPALPSSSFIA
jgi:hypothetical protein